MKRIKLSLAALAVVLSGCSSVTMPQPSSAVPGQVDAAKQALASAQSCCVSLSSLSYQPLPEGDSVLAIDGHSQTFRFEEGMSYLGAYRLPENTGDLVINIAAQIGKSAFVPQVLMLDSNFQVSRVLGPSVFSYQPAHLLKNDRIEGSVYVSRSAIKPEAYMVIYTPAAELAGSTTVLHPAKAFARARSTQEPNIKDPVIPHSPWGLIEIQVEDRAKMQGLDNTFKAEYADKVALSQGVQPTAAVATGAAVVVAAKPKPAPAMLSETEAFYRTQIGNAVKAGDIEKAMKLVDEAERAGSTSARKTFVDAVRQSQK